MLKPIKNVLVIAVLMSSLVAKGQFQQQAFNPQASASLNQTAVWSTQDEELETREVENSFVYNCQEIKIEQASSLKRFNDSFSTQAYVHPLEKTGKILTFVGVPLAIIGTIMVATADELYYECVNGECEGDPKGGFGVIMLGAGGAMSITGPILWAIGSQK